jgi:hypothetical protein
MRSAFASVLFAAALSALTINTAQAWEGSISFSDSERARHAAGVDKVLSTTTSCLENEIADHRAFFNKYRVSKYYGDRSAFAKLPWEDKIYHIQDVLRRLGYRQSEIPRLSQYIRGQMKPTSCVGLVLKCLGNGFKAAGQEDLWNKIAAYTRLNNQDGTSMQDALRKLGWRVLYWNPWTQYSAQWDANEQAKDPTNKNRFWGYHAYRYRTVMSSGRKYLYNTVDDVRTLVDFGRNVPNEFKRIPFFVGTAHTGYHVFPGMYGNVIEGHSTRQITDGQTIESSGFNPLQDGGAPRGSYYSGLMAVPPGY